MGQEDNTREENSTPRHSSAELLRSAGGKASHTLAFPTSSFYGSKMKTSRLVLPRFENGKTSSDSTLMSPPLLKTGKKISSLLSLSQNRLPSTSSVFPVTWSNDVTPSTLEDSVPAKRPKMGPDKKISRLSLSYSPTLAAHADKENNAPAVTEKSAFDIRRKNSSTLLARCSRDSKEKEEQKVDFTPPHLIGFTNPDNRCYMISTLQSLLCLTPFADDLCRSDFKALLRISTEEITGPNKTKILSQLEIVRRLVNFVLYRRNGCRNASDEAVSDLKIAVSKVEPAFGTSEQQDATEFFAFLVNCCKDAIDYVLALDTAKTNGTHTDLERNPFRCNFSIQLQETSSCTKCSNMSVQNQEHLSLILSMPQAMKSFEPRSIGECLGQYMRSDTRHIGNSICGHDTREVTVKFQRLPRILVVQLQRSAFRQNESPSSSSSPTVPNLSYSRLSHPTGHKDTREIHAPVTLSIPSRFTICDGVKLPSEDGWEPVATSLSPLASETFTGSLIPGRTLPRRAAKSKANGRYKDVDEDADDESDFHMSQNALLQHVIKESLAEYNNQQSASISPEPQKIFLPGGGTEESNNASLFATSDSVSSQDMDQTQNEELFPEEIAADYKLVAVVCHLGNVVTQGHYISYCYNVQDQNWYKYNNRDVKLCSLDDDVLSSQTWRDGYMYFYMNRCFFDKVTAAYS